MLLSKGDFLRYVQLRIANTAVGPSTVRGMGPRGTVEAARRYLADIDIAVFAQDSQRHFATRLNRETLRFMKGLPAGARRWGIARKLLNIFLRGAAYNRYLNDAYDLPNVEPWLEVPLDSHVAKALRAEDGGEELPRWRTVIGLEPAVSQQYQDFAAVVARRKGMHRVHLDLLYWRRPDRSVSRRRERRA